MPSRRNARNNKQHSHIYQQPTPSSRPSPDMYPSSLPEDSAGSSGDDAVERSVERSSESSGSETRGKHREEQDSDSEPRQSLPTPPLPEFIAESPLAPLWDDSGTSNSRIRSPILSSLAGHANKNKTFLGDAFSRAGMASDPPSPTSPTTTVIVPIPSTPAARPIATGSDSNSSVRARTNVTSISVESPDVRAPTIAYSDRTANSNDLPFDLDLQHMEGTIRPSVRASSGYGHSHGYSYGYPVEDVDLNREDNEDTGGYVNSSVGRTRPRRAPQYEQPTIRSGSGISRAMARPDAGRQPRPQRAPQADTTRPVIPVSINGAPEEGDPIVSARWDHGLDGRRLLFLFYYPSGMQIWDCTDLGSISEVLNLPSESVRQLIADDSILQSTSEDMPNMIIEYAGIISQGSGEAPLLGILLTPTDEKRDPVDEASDSVLLSAEGDLISRDPDNHSFILIYSLVDHHVVKRIRIPGLSIGGGQFQVGNGFIVASTTVPPSLHILSSTTFDVLHHIPPSHLLAFCHKPPSPSYGGLSPSSQRHSFLETTSNIVNGIYNNYNDHFNDNYQNNNNQRNNVLLPTTNHVDVFSSSSSATGGYPGGQSLDPARQRRATVHGQASQVPELASISIPLPIPETATPLPAPVFSISGRLLAYASLPEGNSTSSSLGATGVGAGVQPRTSSTLSSAAVSTASAFGSTLSAQLAHLGGSAGGGASGALGALGGISQADVGNAALKVGGSVLSGMKSLGGLAYKSAVAAATDSGSRGGAGSRARAGAGAGTGVGGLANRFFSRSAPAATSSTKNRDRRFSIASSNASGAMGTGIEDYAYDAGETVSSDTGPGRPLSVLPRTVPVMESGYHVTVLDLASLVADISLSRTETAATIQARSPVVIMQFIASKSQPVSSIWFSPSGTSLLIATRDGQTVQVFEIRSDPVQQVAGNDEGQHDTTFSSNDRSKKRIVSGHSRSSSTTSNPSQRYAPLHVYNLRRGRTPAVIESADWSSDGRWIAIGTRRRTVHIFAVNPYGGHSDIQSHIDGRVRNLTELPSMPSDLHPLVRLRVIKNPSPDQLRVPLVFAFLEPSVEAERHLPPNFLPPISSPHISPTHLHSYGSVSSNHTVMSSSPSTRSEPLSPRQQLSPNGRPRNFQDVLVFDPTDGFLSLRRITSEVKFKAKEGPSILGASFGPVTVGGMSASRSLPAGIGGRLSISPSHGTSPLHGRMVAPSNVEAPGELIGKENTIASWNLRRGKDWSEKKEALETLKKKKSSEITAGQTNWLAQAELSTYSKAPQVLPRSVYLSHQFSFRALGEDYHALIRRYQFDVAGSKIEVRKGVEVSAYPTGNSESFVEGGGFAIHRDLRRLSSSFDEPLASALSAGLDNTPSQPVLPMFPNGTSGTNPRSFKNSIPIRTMSGLGDGMSEGIGRFRREINKVRSPQLRPSSDNTISTPVPLEFDEEDEDFMSSHEINQGSSHDSSQSVSPGEGPLNEVLSINSHADDVLISDDTAHDDQWPGWVGEDREAVDEVENFDDISAVGFMDEEIHAAKHAAPLSKKNKNKKRN